MRISKKTDYALRALFTLVGEWGKGPIPTREIAKRNAIPKRFLERILLELKAEGWVGSAAGKRGGYFLARPPQEITMGEIVRYFEGAIAPLACVSAAGYEPCSQERGCRFRRVFLEIRNYAAHLLDRATLARVHSGEPVRPEELSEDPGGAREP